ncbi:MAG: CBS domain-containing protein [Planctomycetes bacterium]|nr:CBS domain-containing protein [Planctomycetota bacterium]
MATVEEILMVKGPDVIVATSNTTVQEAAKMMSRANVGSIIVKDGDGIDGIFTERDLLKRVVARGDDPGRTRLGEVMSSPVRNCGLFDSVANIANLLTREHIRHLAVVEDGALIGLIGLRDVMTAQLHESQVAISALRQRIV